MRPRLRVVVTLICGFSAGAAATGIDSAGPVSGAAPTRHANPSSYLDALAALRPGDTLVLAPGLYDDPRGVPGLPIFNKHGEAGRPITIMGEEGKPRPVLRGRSTHNTVRLGNASHIVLRHLEIDGRGLGGDGVKAQGPTHDVTLDDLYIHGVGNDQQTVGISTKAPAWNWVIRSCIVEGAGTGMYLGNSDGMAPFVAGRIERNLVRDSIGYNLQIKHQKSRPDSGGPPADAAVTIVRHNVFAKTAKRSAPGMARPNVLFGHLPVDGPGSRDRYAVYGNFFYENASGECLLQGEGNLAIYGNVFINGSGDAVCVQPHNDRPREVLILYNTILARDVGIAVSGAERAFRQFVAGNAVFARTPIRFDRSGPNVTGEFEHARDFLMAPFAAPGALDLSAKGDGLIGPPLAVEDTDDLPDIALDFDGRRRDSSIRGAYGAAGRPRWAPDLTLKPEAPLGEN